MRILLSLLILLSACNNGAQKDTLSFKDLETMQGNWSGTQTVLANDDQKVMNFPAQMAVTILNDTLELNVTNTDPDGHQETEKGILSINKDGSKLSLGASEYEIKDMSRTKEGLTIVAYKADEDNDKPAEIRLTMIIKAKELTMLREAKYKGTEKYLTRINLQLTRK